MHKEQHTNYELIEIHHCCPTICSNNTKMMSSLISTATKNQKILEECCALIKIKAVLIILQSPNWSRLCYTPPPTTLINHIHNNRHGYGHPTRPIHNKLHWLLYLTSANVILGQREGLPSVVGHSTVSDYYSKHVLLSQL